MFKILGLPKKCQLNKLIAMNILNALIRAFLIDRVYVFVSVRSVDQNMLESANLRCMQHLLVCYWD